MGKARTRYRYVFVVTYGRSGSTLVQGLLNVLPRTLVRGENNLYIIHLFRALQATLQFRRSHRFHDPELVTSAFYGLNEIRGSAFLQATNDIVTTTILGRREPDDYDVLGFKEVLWHRVRPDETEKFFTWLEQTFPDICYVLNTRDPATAAGSGFWRKHATDDALASIARTVEIQDYLRETRPDRVMVTSYETLTGEDSAPVDDMLASLTELVTGQAATPALLDALRSALSVAHGPAPFGASRSETRPAPTP